MIKVLSEELTFLSVHEKNECGRHRRIWDKRIPGKETTKYKGLWLEVCFLHPGSRSLVELEQSELVGGAVVGGAVVGLPRSHHAGPLPGRRVLFFAYCEATEGLGSEVSTSPRFQQFL